jgi:ribosomal protein S27E
MKLAQDKFRKARGGYARLLEIRCEKCKTLLCLYQKDGPGPLKRMYIDRIVKTYAEAGKKLVCHKCGHVLGIRYVYEKEKRPAFRLFEGSVKKKIVKKQS